MGGGQINQAAVNQEQANQQQGEAYASQQQAAAQQALAAYLKANPSPFASGGVAAPIQAPSFNTQQGPQQAPAPTQQQGGQATSAMRQQPQPVAGGAQGAPQAQGQRPQITPQQILAMLQQQRMQTK
jgi:hypothetical protein